VLSGAAGRAENVLDDLTYFVKDVIRFSAFFALIVINGHISPPL
jgi:hypothetical protein